MICLELFLIFEKTLFMKVLKFSLIISLLVFFSQCQKDEFANSKKTNTYKADLAIEYMELLREITKVHPGFSPPVASRAFGYAGVTLYESLVHGMPEYESLAGKLNGLTDLPQPESEKSYHWGLVANAAMNEVIKLFYPLTPSSIASQIEFLQAKYKTDFSDDVIEDVMSRSEVYGKALAAAVFEYSKTDGGHEGFKNNFPAYDVPKGNGFWVPTGANLTPLQPFWGNNRTFVKNAVDHSQPIGHNSFSTDKNSIFYSQALEVYSVSKSLTNEQSTIAQFWSDDPGAPGTPPGHSVSIATIALKNTNATLSKAAETYAKLGMAVSDAFVSCWKCKYVFNLLRPITYIRENIDASWTTLLPTPAFPEYTSGHSVQSGATARVLSDLFGYNFSFMDNTHAKRTDINGSPRTFRSFDHFAAEAAISRLYGGIHYRQAIELGVDQGTKVGDLINSLKFKE